MGALTDDELKKLVEKLWAATNSCGLKALADAVVAANNAKMLKDLKPFDVVSEKDCSEPYGDFRDVPYYSADQVAALMQERDVFKAKTEELRSALDLCYEHCRLYHPHVEKNNVGGAVGKALKATS